MLRCGEVHRVGMQVNSGAVVAASADRAVRVPVVSEKVVRERVVRERVVLPRAARKRVVRSGEGLAGVVLVREEASDLVAVDPEVRVSVVVADFRVAAVVSEAALGMVLVEAVRAVGVTVGVLAGRPAAASFQACGRPRGGDLLQSRAPRGRELLRGGQRLASATEECASQPGVFAAFQFHDFAEERLF